MKFLGKIKKYPIPGWLFALVTSVYCEILLHLWTPETIFPRDASFGRLAVIGLFALGFGGLLGQIVSFIGHQKWGKWVTTALIAGVSVFYIVEYCVVGTGQTGGFTSIGTVIADARGVATDYAGNVVGCVRASFWQILAMLLPTVLFAVFARPVQTSWKLRWFLLAGTLAAYLLGYCAVLGMGEGSDFREPFSEYKFNSATNRYGLNMAVSMELSGKVSKALDNPELAAPALSGTPENTLPAQPTVQPEANKPETAEAPERNELDGVDFSALAATATNSRIAAIHADIASQTASAQNDYTGLFAGKNLILITAEAFTKEVIDEEMTPTLYRLANEGFCFTDYYQPAWGASTISGEFSNLIGLVPTNGGSCMKEVNQQNFFLTMGHQLQKLGYSSTAYHNSDGKFYDRYKTHTQLGYDQFLSLYGGLNNIQPVWPESDREMIDETVPQYIGNQPFSIYYITVSGHTDYTLKGNAMAKKNYDKVADLDWPETTKCYLASQLELEYAMESLVTQLEATGIADDTVIVLAADHYPYGLTKSGAWGNVKNYLDEFFGEDEEAKGYYGNFKRDHNALIIWSGDLQETLEEKQLSQMVDTPVYSLDILPTLSNLFGLDYDSRLLVGRDVFSDQMPLVLWPDGSWRTEHGVYDALNRKYISLDGTPEDVNGISEIVKGKIAYSRDVLEYDYFQALYNAINAQ